MMSSAAFTVAPEIVEFLVSSNRNTQVVHLEMAIGTAIALTGEFALCAVKHKLPKSD